MDEIIFNAMLKEAQFTCEMLCSGYTQIRKANYAKKGIYFQAFTSLSTGFERICKLCYILIFAIENNSRFPDSAQMKAIFGHDILKLYEEIRSFKAKYNIKYTFQQEIDGEIYQDILKILSRFGKGDRYSNIDLLINNCNYEDPISVWYKKIDLYVYRNNISATKKEQIEKNAIAMGSLLSDSISVYHSDEDNNMIDTSYDYILKSRINDVICPYRQQYIFHIIRYFSESLFSIEKIIRSRNLFEIPYFSEIFGVFYNTDSYMRTRKTISM